MENKELKEKIFEITDDISKLDVRNITTPTPTNITEEKLKFKRDKFYQPQFKYIAKDNYDKKKGIDDLFLKVENIQFPSDVNKYFIDLLIYLYNQCTLAESRGTGEFKIECQKAFDWKFHSEIPELKFNNNKSNILLSADDIKDKFEKQFNDLSIKGWIVLIEDHRHSVGILPKSQIIKIPKDIIKDEIEVNRLIVHEILGHVLRRVSTLKSVLSTIRKGIVKDYVLYEEGFAVYNEYRYGLLDNNTWNKYNLRLEVIRDHFNKSFREIYNLLLDRGFGAKSSFDMTLRFKRGFGDTSQEGLFPKDAAYLIGFINLYNLMQKDNSLYDFMKTGKVTPNERFLLEIFNSD
jgi:hypothetical protein